MICKRCGKTIPEGLIYCPSCGEKGEENLKDQDFSVLKVVANTQTINEMSRQLDDGADYDAAPQFEPDPDDLTEEYLEALSPKERKAWEKRRRQKEKEAEKAAKAEAKAKVEKAKAGHPGNKGRVGRFFLTLLLLAALGAGGYFAYITWLSPEARFTNAMLKGAEMAESGDYSMALEYYTKAVGVDSRSKEAYMARANVYLATGDLTRAVDDYIKAYFIDTSDAALCEKLGDAYFQQQIYDNARNYYDSALKLVPQRAELYGKLADVELQELQRDTALEVLERGIQATGDEELQKKYDALLSNKFEDYMAEGARAEENGDPEAAITAYGLAMALQSERTESYVARAKVYAAQKKYSEAASDYRKAIALGDKTADNYLGYVDAEEARLGDRKESDRDLVSMLEEGWQETGSELLYKRLTAVTPSQAAGGYETPFSLSLSSYCNLFYTLDGSRPTTEAEHYSKPLEIGVGDTVLTVLPVSLGGAEGEPVVFNYNVTTVEMKALSAFETYFNEHFNDKDQDVFLYDVSGDGLQDMIIVDRNSDDAKIYRVRVYVYDGSVVTPVYNFSKAREESFFLARYDGKYALASLTVEEEKKDDKTLRTETYELYTVLQDNETETVRTFKLSYENGKLLSSDLEGEDVSFAPLLGVPYLSIDAFGKFDAPDNDYVAGSAAVQVRDGTLLTPVEALAALVPGAEKLNLPEGAGPFLLHQDTLYYYGAGKEDAKVLFSLPLESLGGDAQPARLGEGDGETLVYSGGWLYVGENRRLNPATGESKTDTYPNVDALVLMDGRYLFYHVKLADGLTRSDRDLFNAVDVLAKYDENSLYFTTDEGLFVLTPGEETTLAAYTLSGSFLYRTALEGLKPTGAYLTSGSDRLFLLTEGGAAELSLVNGKLTKTWTVEGLGKESRPVALASGCLVLDKDGKGREYLVLNLGDGSVTGAARGS